MSLVKALMRSGETEDDLRLAFMKNVAVHESGCWYWRGKADRYGTFRSKPAHCVSWELHQGPIPEGMFILHGCDIALAGKRAEYGCVNPAHLRPGTPRENAQDTRRAKTRASLEEATAVVPSPPGAPADPGDTIAVRIVTKQPKFAALLRYVAAVTGVEPTRVFLTACEEVGVSDWIENEARRLLCEQLAAKTEIAVADESETAE